MFADPLLSPVGAGKVKAFVEYVVVPSLVNTKEKLLLLPAPLMPVTFIVAVWSGQYVPPPVIVAFGSGFMFTVMGLGSLGQ